LEYWLSQNTKDFPTRTVFAKLGDVSKGSRFGIIQRDLLDGISVEGAIDLAFGYMQSGKNLMNDLQQVGIPHTICQAFNKLFVATPGQPPPEIVVTSWNYLRGIDVGKAGAALGLHEQIDNSKDFYFVLAALGHMVQAVEKRQLLFLVDEAARLEAVSDALEVERHWVNVNTMIFDQENKFFGFVYTVSGKSSEDIPRALFEPQIENRLGNRRLELQNLAPEDVRKFLRALRDAFVDRDAVESAMAKSSPEAHEFDWDTFPFTASALDRFVSFFQRGPENSKPRDIADRLDEAAFYALKAGKTLIDDAVLEDTKV
jgi:hypothetical protein